MKRLICCIIATTLLLTGVTLGAATHVSEGEKAQVLRELEIMQGNASGDLELTRTVTRAEFTKLMIAASPYRDTVGSRVATDPYPDVQGSHWAAPYVQTARDTGLVLGRLDGTFRPGDPITLAEGATMVLRLLGYSDNANWPVAQLARYTALGLDEGVTAKGRDDVLTRADALHLFYNLLTVKTQAGAPYISTFGYGLNTYGAVDLDAILAAGREGPLLATGDWQAQIPFPLSGASLTRNGRVVTSASVSEYDVLYYTESSRTVEVWSERVTGTITAVLPNTGSPSSVVVGGQSYALETREMTAAFSAQGLWHKGDVVTLLLGRTGGVAGVISAHESQTVTYGVVTAIAQAGALDGDGNPYSATTVTIFGTDGMAHSFVWAKDNVAVGDLASGQYTAAGPVVTRLSRTTLTGSYRLAEDARILDTFGETQCAAVYPSRLDGVKLTGDMVRYYVTNADGEITDLILNNVTGDLHKYGVVTESTEVSAGMTLMGTYRYDMAGLPGVYSSNSKLYGVGKGPFQLRSDGISALKSVSLTAPSGRQGYPAAEGVLYYERDRDGNYTHSSLARLTAGDFIFTGWYDKPESEGGRIRVIVAA